jgi:ribonucleoside-diphosphate reductase alpha subunit
MRVKKRNGSFEPVSFDKILVRIQRLTDGSEGDPLKASVDPLSSSSLERLIHVDPFQIAQKVIAGIYDGVLTTELDNLAAETAAYMTSVHPQYETLASRIAVSNLQKETQDDYLSLIEALYSYVNPKTGKHGPLVSKELLEIVREHRDEIQKELRYARDFDYSYFGFKTLARSYLLKMDGKIVERPQHMLMRVSLGIHLSNSPQAVNLKEAFKTYDLMSRKVYTHASPTMFNAGTPNPQCSSCFLLTVSDDSIPGMYDTMTQCAKISKMSGGIGVNMSNIRAAGSYIAGTNGISSGLTPYLRVYNACARHVDQGSKRKGAFAIYIEPWHADILDVLELKKNTGPDELRARDLFYGLWIPDLFMKRVRDEKSWSLMCPDECPGLMDVHSEEFEKLYEHYEAEGRAKSVIPARELWYKILESQMETGTPYMLFKDSCNAKSNQKNLGTIRGSNLCTEVIEFTSPDEVAVCNLASVALNKFVVKVATASGCDFDHKTLYETVYQMTRNLNRVIDINSYPIPEARTSNLRHRPIGLGVQGLADTFFLMRYPFDSPEAAQLNRDIFETIYYAACKASNDLAKEQGPYETFRGSPASYGLLQFDLWQTDPSDRFDWASLKADIIRYGLRNSLLVAPMPTASTAQILGNTECFEPISSNIYSRSTLAGTFSLVNRYLVDDLMKLGLWSTELKDEIIRHNGSIQNIPKIPQDLKDLYKTVWEIKQRVIIGMAADRGVFIDQSQSLNIHLAEPTYAGLTTLHFLAWERGLKTGMYYLRSKGAANPIKFTIEEPEPEGPVCTMKEGCLSCGS